VSPRRVASHTSHASCTARTARMSRVSRVARVALAAAVTAVTITAAGAPTLGAQLATDTVLLAAGPHYEAGSVRRLLHGGNWRELWAEPIRVPVLDVRRFAGGLEPERRGGGSQSITLHMIDAAGRGWIFRSIDKHLQRGFPDELRDTPAGFIVADHVSMLHPGGAFVLPPLLEAAGVLHVQPMLFVMPDDPALGEFRADYAGMLGALELKPDQGPDRTPGFAGSRRIRGTESFLEDLQSSQAHRLDEAEFLRARLVDFLVGDPDRGTDQWRWARFGEQPHYTWRPIPRDRDWALAHADGLLAGAMGWFYGKLTRFETHYPDLAKLTYSTHILDRRLLTRLTRQEVAAEAARLQAAITDSVIAAAVAGMPPEYAALSGAEVAATLRARRDRLPVIAADFYYWLASEVDVRGTDERDLVEIERRADGSVHVRIRALPDGTAGGMPDDAPADAPADAVPDYAAADPPLFYERVFVPDETREIRVHLLGGDDRARITGTADGPIVVRVISSGGTDLLEDLAGGARFHDARGASRVVPGPGTRLDDKPWSPLPPPEGLRANLEWAPDWGATSSFGPAADYRNRAGVLLGARAAYTRFGFRRLPHAWALGARALYAPATRGAVVELDLDQRAPNSRRGLRLEAHASNADEWYFHGFGNDPVLQDDAPARIGLDQVGMSSSVVWLIGPRPGQVHGAAEPDAATADVAWTAPAARRAVGSVAVGAVFGRTDPRMQHAGAAAAPLDDGAVTRLGAHAVLALHRADRPAAPRRGFRLALQAAAYPLVTGAADVFGNVAVEGSVYVPLPGRGPHLALRAGGGHAFGDYPFFEAATIGGRSTVRGLRQDRYAGDTGAYGTAELRVPLDSVVLFFRTEAGAFAFGDAGRVWHDGVSAGSWHTGVGAGVWLALFGRSVSLAVARSDATRAYAWLGLPF
jgi:hypothetical protein